MIISDYAIKRKTTVFVLMLLLAVAGVYAYLVLPREAAPDIPIPIMLVMTSNRGVAPTDIENTITIPMERELEGLDDLKKLTSTSSEGMSVVVLEFQPSIKLEDALRKVKDQVEKAKGKLPQEAESPVVRDINVSEFPIIALNVHGKAHPDRVRNLIVLREVADRLKDAIETVPGVLEVIRVGGLTPEVRIEIDPNKLAAYRIPAAALVARYLGEDVKISAGSTELGNQSVDIRVPMEFERDIDAAKSVVIAEQGGKAVYLGDVADIVPGFEEESSRSRFNGEESIGLIVQKKTGENLIHTAEGIKYALKLARESGRIPEGVQVDVTLDESKFIKMLVDDLDNNILTGFFLVALFVMLVMGFRNAMFVAIAIPYSFLITLAYFWIRSVSLNFVVLFSLIMALGMVVDNAIVVVENIFRHRQMGYKPDEAAMKATGEVAWPVITSTLTTLAAFAPLLFWPGIVGKFMGFLPLTVIVALTASLFVGLVINPTVCAKWMRVPEGRKWGAEGRKLNAFLRGYKRLLETSLRWKWSVALGSFGLLAAVTALYVASGPGIEFFPDSEPQSAFVDVTLPEGTRLEKTDDLAKRIERTVAEVDAPGDAKSLSASVGTLGLTSHVLVQGAGSPNIARVSLEFKDIDDRKRRSSDTVELLRKALQAWAVGEVQVKREAMGPPSDAPVNLEISGEDFDVLGRLADRAFRIVRGVPGVVDLRDDYEPGRPELKVTVDRKRAALLGLNPLLVGLTLQTAYRGSKVGVVRFGEDEYDVNVIAPKADRKGFGLLDKLYLTTATGGLVPASSVAEWNLGGGPGAIKRVDRRRVVTVAGNVAKGFRAPEVRSAVEKALKEFREKELPPGYGIRLTGEQEQMAESQSFLFVAFVAACFLIALIMVAQFNSLRIMLIIMSEVVLSLAGVFIGLLVTRQPFGVIMTGVGVISLAGVVVNNGIILMDFVEKLRERGFHPFHALVEAGLTRIRPVLLTAVTTVAGLAPMAVGLSVDFHRGRISIAKEMAQWWGPMAIAVVFGLSVATVLTLVVALNLYAVLYGVKPPPPGTEEPKNVPQDIA